MLPFPLSMIDAVDKLIDKTHEVLDTKLLSLRRGGVRRSENAFEYGLAILRLSYGSLWTRNLVTRNEPLEKSRHLPSERTPLLP